MVEKLLQSIFDKTIAIIENSLCEYQVDYKQDYFAYLREKYEMLLQDFVSTESDSTINAIVESYIEDETRLWKSLSKNEMLSVLEEDTAFEHLSFLSETAFNQAKKCLNSGTFLKDEVDYTKQLEELSLCLDNIKFFNLAMSKEILSEAILDIEYAFKKTTTMSLRLSRLK